MQIETWTEIEKKEDIETCSQCDEAIEDEYVYDLDGEIWCPDCIRKKRRFNRRYC